MAQDDTVTFEQFSFNLCLRLTSPNYALMRCRLYSNQKVKYYVPVQVAATVMPTKSDSDVILCLQLLSKTLTCTLHFS